MVSVERQRFQFADRSHQDRAAGRLIAAARLHADEAVLHQIDASHAVFAADALSSSSNLDAAQLLLPVDETGTPCSKPMVTSAGLVGRLFGLLVSIQMPSGAALAGSSSSPPSCEMCQMLRSRLKSSWWIARSGRCVCLAYSMASSRETMSHSRQGAMTFRCGAMAL